MEMGLDEGEAPTRVIASFFQISGELLGAGTAQPEGQGSEWQYQGSYQVS